MHFHYALVDDLITKEEFERRVEAKIEDCGDLVDEPTAAMMVSILFMIFFYPHRSGNTMISAAATAFIAARDSSCAMLLQFVKWLNR